MIDNSMWIQAELDNRTAVPGGARRCARGAAAGGWRAGCASPTPPAPSTENMGDVAHTSQTMIGRDAELEEIASSLGVRAVPAGRPDRARCGIALVSGDAGVGKTRLLKAVRDLAHDEGWQVLAGHCLDFGDSALPYLPFSEVLGRLAIALPDVVDRVAALQPALARLLPGRRVRLPARRRRAGGDPPRSTARSTAPTSSTPCTPCSRPPPTRRRCCWSSRTSTGPTSRRATCSASCSPGRSSAGSRWWRRTAPTTCTAGTRCAGRWPSGRGCATSTGSS